MAVCATLMSGACGRDNTLELGAQTAAPAAVRVTVATVAGEDQAVTIEATGGFEPAEASDVAPEMAGVVVATPVDVGQSVRAGALLVRLQGTDAALAVDAARATVARAESNLKLAEAQNQLAQLTARRYDSLLATGDVSRTVADQARTQAETTLQTANTARASLAEARAQLARAQHDVSHIVVTAPFAGQISQRMVSLGEYVQPSTPVVRLLKTDPLRLHLAIPAVQAGQVTVGQAVSARVDAYPDRSFNGEITAINPAISPESRTFTAEARVPNPTGVLKAGMFAVATVARGSTERVLRVPRAAVVEDVNTNSFRLFVVDATSRARLRVVQLAARQEGDQVRILTGVKEGERVATSNLGDLYDGAPVEVVTGAP